MLSIKELVAKLQAEDNLRRKEYERQSAEQDEKYEKLINKVIYIKDEGKKFMDKITNGLDELVSNKHTIEKALEQTSDLTGLPIPHEQHEATIDLVSKMTGFMNSTEALKSSNVFSPEEIYKDVQTVVETVSHDLNDCHTGLVQAQALYQNTKLLKNLIAESNEEEVQKLDNTLYTIAES